MGMMPKDERTSAAMAKVRQARTAPEERVATSLRELGFAYRRNVKSLPGKPDFANRSKGWAIQVHGCFWHQHDCKRGTMPAHNRDAWKMKLARNKARDIQVNDALENLGLSVLTLWECETRDPTRLKEKISNHLVPFAPSKLD